MIYLQLQSAEVNRRWNMAWMSNYILHDILHVITYQWPNFTKFMLVRSVPGVAKSYQQLFVYFTKNHNTCNLLYKHCNFAS